MDTLSGHTPPLFYIEPSMVDGDRIILTGQPMRHALVLRLMPGESFRAVAGDTLYNARVVHSGKDTVEAIITSVSKPEPFRYRVHLYAAVLKGDKFDLVVEKATELGVSSITPLITSRTIPRLEPEKAGARVERWKKVARAASQQCGRTTMPEILDVTPYGHEILMSSPGVRLIASERHKDRGALPDMIRDQREVSVMVGPEGGFSPQEVEMAMEAGFSPFSLGPLILRAETACIVSVGILAYLMEFRA